MAASSYDEETGKTKNPWYSEASKNIIRVTKISEVPVPVYEYPGGETMYTRLREPDVTLSVVITSFEPGELVEYTSEGEKFPKVYLVKDVIPYPLRLVLQKFNGGTKRVDAQKVKHVEDCFRKIFKGPDEVPTALLLKYYPRMLHIVGTERSFRIFPCVVSGFHVYDIKFHCIGEFSKYFLDKIVASYPDLRILNTSKSNVALILSHMKPIPGEGVFLNEKKSIDKALAAKKLILIVYVNTLQFTPDGWASQRDSLSRLSPREEGTFFPDTYIIEIPDLFGSLPKDKTALILSLGALQRFKRKMLIPF